MRFWSQIVAYISISVMMVLFHNTECGNNGNNLKSFLLLLLSLFHSDCIGLAYGAVM